MPSPVQPAAGTYSINPPIPPLGIDRIAVDASGNAWLGGGAPLTKHVTEAGTYYTDAQGWAYLFYPNDPAPPEYRLHIVVPLGPDYTGTATRIP